MPRQRSKKKRFTGKRSRERHREDPSRGEQVKRVRGTAEYLDTRKVVFSEDFAEHYKVQGIVPEEEWDAFIACLKTDLPTTFRINVTGFEGPLLHRCRTEFANLKDLVYVPVERKITRDESKETEATVVVVEESRKVAAPKPVPWFPNDMCWHISENRGSLRRVRGAEVFRSFLIRMNEVGLITRQEAVSMIPPLFLQPEPHHFVLDMCAAPGSKTSQIIGVVQSALNHTITTGENSLEKALHGFKSSGMVFANDSDADRGMMLVHQLKRLNSPCYIVTNHDASVFPRLYMRTEKEEKEEEKKEEAELKEVWFDRVLCDVPCSGDGTLRKNMTIWRRWKVADALGLHSLQIRILKRGLQLVRPGGKVVYSTCSFNPIENEAVVSEILRSVPDAELMDVSSQLPALKRNSGLQTWKVQSKSKEWFSSFEEVPAKLHSKLTPSMFPLPLEHPKSVLLKRCMRFLPHHQDTGGFFVAVFQRMTSDVAPKVAEAQPKPLQLSKKQQEMRAELLESVVKLVPASKPYLNTWSSEPFVPIQLLAPQIVRQIKEHFDMTDAFPWHCLFGRVSSCKREDKELIPTKVYFMNHSLTSLFGLSHNSRLKVVHAGIRMLVRDRRTKQKKGSYLFRLTQDGVLMFLPFLQRFVFQAAPQDLWTLFMTDTVKVVSFSARLSEGLLTVEPQRTCVLVLDNSHPDLVEGGLSHTIAISVWKTAAGNYVAHVNKPDRKNFVDLLESVLKPGLKLKFEQAIAQPAEKAEKAETADKAQ